MLTYKQVFHNEEIRTYVAKADEVMEAIGYTEHSFAHVGKVAHDASTLLLTLGYSQQDAELARIAGYMHDIGNVLNRHDHAQSGALMAFQLLREMGATPQEVATVVSAIGNHDEGTAYPINPVAAALILADKTDVRRSRVRNNDIATFDIHDRVNYAVEQARTEISEQKDKITLIIKIDTSICAVMDYFEIFLDRMLLCRRAAEKLNLHFGLVINEQEIM